MAFSLRELPALTSLPPAFSSNDVFVFAKRMCREDAQPCWHTLKQLCFWSVLVQHGAVLLWNVAVHLQFMLV